LKKGTVFCSILALMGTLDWLTTVVGITNFGASEANPLMAGLTGTSLLLFTDVKLSTIALVGLLFYKSCSAEISGGKFQLGRYFPDVGYSLSLVFLTFVVVNNTMTIMGLM
jgi:Domain of unknown function (DUF5658)